jgi:hypothetical protein
MYDNILAIIASLAGLGSFISVLVNLLKAIGVVKDGTADKWYEGISLGAFAIVAVVYFMRADVDWTTIDAWLQSLASLIGLVVQLVSGRITYEVFRGMPLIGYSHTIAKS